jgi:aerobic-type carbon monoxide dehydrogenase small subunit (CoxS/CutS family)
VHSVSLTLNGRLVERQVESRLLLSDFLRHDVDETGTHVGCEHGVCGACTVLWNGKPVRSCIMLAVQADGSELTTVEGLSRDGELHPVQQAFLEEHGLQCGFCTPGFLLSISELLERNPKPSDEEIMETLGGHICRCTGYENIFRAVQSAIRKVSDGR